MGRPWIVFLRARWRETTHKTANINSFSLCSDNFLIFQSLKLLYVAADSKFIIQLFYCNMVNDQFFTAHASQRRILRFIILNMTINSIENLSLSTMEPKPADDLEAVIETLRRHNYDFRGKIGEGGHATVFSVWSQKYGELFVAKKIPVKPSQEITSEVELLMNLQHPNIINMYEYWCEENNLYVILEYCSKGSLKDYIKANGPLNPQLLRQACREIASAVEFCHANNVVHRDIKPANLLIDKYDRIKLADFGISVQAGTQITANLGSPAYLSPEIILGRPNIDYFKSDIWALGVTIFELCAGVVPWSAKTFNDMKSEILVGLLKRPPLADYSFLKLLKAMMDNNPVCRPTISQVLSSEYLSTNGARPLPRQIQRRLVRKREPKMLTSPKVAPSPKIAATLSRGLEQSETGFTPIPPPDSPIALRDLANSPLSIMFAGYASSQTMMRPIRRYPSVTFQKRASIGNVAIHNLAPIDDSDDQ